MPSFMRIRPVGDELLHAEGWTDMKLTAAFCNFANAPKYARKFKDMKKEINTHTVLRTV